MNDLHQQALSTEVEATYEFDLDYIVRDRFVQLVIARALAHVVSDQWATERMTLEGVHQNALTTLKDRTERAAVLDISADLGGNCLVLVSLQRGRAYVTAAAESLDTLTAAKEWVRNRYPVVEPAEKQQATLTFWTASGRGPHPMTRRIDVPTWTEIAGNYPAAVAAAIAPLMEPVFRPENGQLLLWHGQPGTGKTYAIRALAWEWRSWCRLHYVTDPEVFFGNNARYMLDVLLNERDEDDDDAERWRLLILEDTGELLRADAKEQAGQGLSRLLNVADGLIGQGLRVMVLVTTNELLGRLHPAVSRPGRCASVVEFTPFSPEEAAAWLERHGSDAEGRQGTLASLFARSAGVEERERNPIGFTA